MQNLIGLTKTELAAAIANLNLRPFRASQIWAQIYVRGVLNFAEMTDIAKQDREILAKNFTLTLPEITFDKTSHDGTRKFLIKFADNNEIEMVFIPEESRGTLCISSQIGCTLSCKFCHTGTQTLVRNLTPQEIIAQILIAKKCLDDHDKSHPKLTNVVFMGMGEPFYNYENIKKSVEIMLDQKGLSFSKRRVTVSTSGLVPEIERAATELKTTLAISLHAGDDETRTKIMAINKRFPLHDLMSACQFYNQENPSQKITFEYVMLAGVNDSDQDAQNLAKLVKKYRLKAKFNLIPFNPWMSCGFEKSSNNRIHAFQKILQSHGLTAPIRKTRGDDVMAACGQLKSESLRQKQIKNRHG